MSPIYGFTVPIVEELESSIFKNLGKIQKESNAKKKWSELGDYHSTIYFPILKAFIKELKNLYKKDRGLIPSLSQQGIYLAPSRSPFLPYLTAPGQ